MLINSSSNGSVIDMRSPRCGQRHPSPTRDLKPTLISTPFHECTCSTRGTFVDDDGTSGFCPRGDSRLRFSHRDAVHRPHAYKHSSSRAFASKEPGVAWNLTHPLALHVDGTLHGGDRDRGRDEPAESTALRFVAEFALGLDNPGVEDLGRDRLVRLGLQRADECDQPGVEVFIVNGEPPVRRRARRALSP